MYDEEQENKMYEFYRQTWGEYYANHWKRLQEMNRSTINIDYLNSGMYYLKTNKLYARQVKNLKIRLSGFCRTAGVKIEVNGQPVVDEWNCSAHKEWKPN